jgi:hypothetical protein
MRKAQVRLSRPHTRLVGAQLPGANRLYELTNGAMKNASSRIPAIRPPRKCRIVSDIPYGEAPGS